MKQNIKITKRELKEDKFTTNMLLTKEYIIENWIYFVGGAAIIILLIIGIPFLQQEQTKKEQAAVDIYNRAAGQYSSKSYDLAIVDFKLILDEYGSSSIAEQAAFDLGNAHFYAKNYNDAKTTFENYLQKYEGNNKFFTTSAIAGIAASLANSGDMAGAADKYREAAEKYEDMSLAAGYYLQAMKHYVLSDNIESARVLYAKLEKDFENSQYYREAMRLAGEYRIEL